MRFHAIDFETANCNLYSICQVGVVTFDDGALAGGWETLIDPESWFDEVNIDIHGITERDVEGAPVFAGVYPRLRRELEGQIVVCHTHFDRTALARAVEASEREPFDCRWLDTARVARRAWQQYAQRGYGLANIASDLGIEFRHHNAKEDARAAGLILLAASAETGLTIEGWFRRVRSPMNPAHAVPISREGNPEGPLYGETLVFTGALTLPRREAADRAAKAGCVVGASVTKKTTMLVVGDQDARRLAGHKRSSKHRRALDLIAKGQSLRILSETDFQHIAELVD